MSASSEYRALEEAARDAAYIYTLCSLCGWSHEGAAGEARERAREHRLSDHPALKISKRHRQRALGSWSQRKLDAETQSEIMAERDKRARLHGIEHEIY